MNLGVLLYTLKTRDLRRYAHWLNWVDSNGTTTQLCDLDKDHKVVPGTCKSVYWPRVCEKDLGYLEPGTTPQCLPYHRVRSWFFALPSRRQVNAAFRSLPKTSKRASREPLITALRSQIITIRTRTIADTQRKLQEAQQQVLNLDAQLQDAQNKLQKKVLQTAVSIARAELALKAHLLNEARKRVADVQRVNNRVKRYVCVWKKDSKCMSES
jgi:hypothetical protein